MTIVDEKPMKAFNIPLLLAFVALTLTVLWGLWVTKTLVQGAKDKNFVSVSLQPLISEYVQAQAVSNSSEDVVTRQTDAFMKALEGELILIGKRGQTVLVAEAVLSKDVPDITSQVRKAVYAKVPLPRKTASLSTNSVR
jgi:uncharacterized membrane protein YiaA